jgi:hypothetical protein
MAITKFAKPIEQDNFRELLCAIPGCGARWSVNFGKPMCSLHQWGQYPVRSESRSLTQEERDNIHDKKWWAKKIMSDVEEGIKKPIAVVEMAKRALKITDDVYEADETWSN